jgi:hypothetical protein
MARTAQAPQVPVTFMDSPRAPDIYADAISGVAFFSGNIRLTLEAAHVDHSTSPGPVNRVVIGRLVMPLSAATDLHTLLTDYLGRIKAGEASPPAPGPTKH